MPNIEKLPSHLEKFLLNNIPDAIIITDEQIRIQLWNNEAEKIYVWKDEEVIGNNLEELLKTEFLNEQPDDVLRQLRENGRWEGIVKHYRKDKQTVDIYAHTNTIFDNEKNVIGYISVNRDITHSGLHVNDILGVYQQMRELTRHLQIVREEERTRIAREIHDDLGQILTTLKMNLYSLTESRELDASLISTKLDRSLFLVDNAITTVRRIASELRIPILDHLGLIPAIEWQIKEFEENTKIICNVSLIKEVLLDNDKSTAVFRIFQEVLNNITKHSKADKVDIDISVLENNLMISVADNGIGFTSESLNKSNSFGIIGIRERIKLFNGEFKIKRLGNEGTRVLILIPI